MLRPVLQALLCAPVLPTYPFVLLFTFSIFTPRFWGEVSAFTWENWLYFLIYPAAAVGLPALLASIFIPPTQLNSTRWLRRLVVAGLMGGSITAITFLAVTLPADFREKNWRAIGFDLWQLGGPLVVALWNLIRLRQASARVHAPATPPPTPAVG